MSLLARGVICQCFNTKLSNPERRLPAHGRQLQVPRHVGLSANRANLPEKWTICASSRRAQVVTSSVSAPSLLAKVAVICAAVFYRLQALLLALSKPGTVRNLLDQAASAVSNLLPHGDARSESDAKAALPAAPPPFPADWHLVSSASEWFDLQRSAASQGALLATVFVSDKAAAHHAPMLERLRRVYGTGPTAAVRFVYVHVQAGFLARQAAARAPMSCPVPAPPGCGAPAASPLRMAATAAAHGLDVALAACLPQAAAARCCPALLLTAGLELAGGGTRWAAVTRVGDMEQMIGDWDFVNRRFTAVARMAQAAAAAAAAAEAPPADTDAAADAAVVKAPATPAAAAGPRTVPGSTRTVRVAVPAAKTKALAAMPLPVPLPLPPAAAALADRGIVVAA